MVVTLHDDTTSLIRYTEEVVGNHFDKKAYIMISWIALHWLSTSKSGNQKGILKAFWCHLWLAGDKQVSSDVRTCNTIFAFNLHSAKCSNLMHSGCSKGHMKLIHVLLLWYGMHQCYSNLANNCLITQRIMTYAEWAINNF